MARAWWFVCVPIVATGLFLGLSGYEHLLAFFEDDASYYFLIAENIVKTGHSTFDGIATTTGYHPLWLVVNVALAWITGSREAWLAGLVVVCTALAIGQAFLLSRLLSRLAPASPSLVNTSVIVVSAWSLRFSFSGMECAVATPMLVWCALHLLSLLDEPKPSNAGLFRLGLLSAGCGLARVDALLFGLACGAAALLMHRTTWIELFRRGLFYAVGLTPFVVYLGINRAISGSLLTTSAQAKSLAPTLAWNYAVFDNINSGGRIALGVCLLGALLVASRLSPLRGSARVVALVSFGFPAAYYASLGIRSSWRIWSWYLYPIPLALGIALVALGQAANRALAPRNQSMTLRASRIAVPLSVALAALLAFRIARDPGNNEGTRDSARDLARFARAHPGYYAMGDRAGVTAFLVPHPFLQLEGLVADRAFLDAIRHERPLREVLTERRVDYLVEAVPNELLAGRCLKVEEPKPGQAGMLSPKLRGEFCDPVFRIPDKLGWVTTLVYDLKLREAAR